MIYALILGPIFALLIGGALGYFAGRYQREMIDKIRTLEGQARQEVPAEPEKPAVVAGAYQPPKEVSTSIDKPHGAGLVETKTPERLNWENQQEIENLSKI